MHLLIDQGNSAVKWQIVSSDKIVAAGRAPLANYASVLECDLAPHRGDIARAWVSSVAGAVERDKLAHILSSQLFRAAVHFAEVLPELAGLRPAYAELSRLGVDRWLAMLALHLGSPGLEHKDKLVISLGTAITVDKLGADGRHLGGQIAPGWSTLTAILTEKTANIRTKPMPFADAWAAGALLGDSTDACVALGVSAMLRFYIEGLVDALAPSGSSAVVLCGGDASSVAAALSSSYLVCVRESLVLDGLALLAGFDKSGSS